MPLEFDEKGKFYTDIVAKVSLPAIIQTTTHRISGLIHMRPDERVSDALDGPGDFLAVTSAIVFGLQGEILFQAEFLSVRRSQIVWVMPEEHHALQSAPPREE